MAPVMAKNIRMLVKVKEGIANAWAASAKYIAGFTFFGELFIGMIGLITLIAAMVVGGYDMLVGYALMVTCFSFLLSVPLGLFFKMSLEEDF